MTTQSEVLSDILLMHASEQPEKPFAIFPGRETWTYGAMPSVVDPVIRGLAALGVAEGDAIFTWLPNGPEFLQIWFGTNCLGAIHAPCNLFWRGDMLSHALSISDARIAFVHSDLLPRLAEVERHRLDQVIVIGGTPTALPGVEVMAYDAFLVLETEPVAMAKLGPWSIMQRMFTSGTTGPSKAVASPYRQAAQFLARPYGAALGAEARFLLVLPLFHAGGKASVYSVFRSGGTLVIPRAFRTDEFWPLVREHRVTSTTLVEQMASFLLAVEPAATDAENSLSFVNIAPMRDTAYGFAERFGATLWSSYGSTEVGAPVSAVADPSRPGLTGAVRHGYQARIVDENDMPLPPGTVGQLVIRSDLPWTMMTEYAGDPEATVSVLRNGWLHTGDMFRRDSEGLLYFVDRAKDCIRRRGENISSLEVEREVKRCDWIREVAAYAVRADTSEDEVMVALEVSGEPDWPALVESLRTSMPHFMVPRYFRVVSELPRTANGKIRKDSLKSEGVTKDSWDREAFGIFVKAERIA